MFYRLATTNQHLQFMYGVSNYFPGNTREDIKILRDFYETLQDRVARYEIERHQLLTEKEKLERLMAGSPKEIKGIPVINTRLDSYNEINQKIKDLDAKEIVLVLAPNIMRVISESLQTVWSDREARTDVLNSFPYPQAKEQNIKVLINVLQDVGDVKEVGEEYAEPEEDASEEKKTEEGAPDA